MEIYLVGGAVRDELLGRPVHERDWVVVGGSTEGMLSAGYRQVGRDFPVFLHPETGEEHALARTERKTGPGHTGFEVHADLSVTLEDDLKRRDLTINAMARSASGTLIDCYGGRKDLGARVLRHVSDAFGEDPLRVFRVARFAAQLPGFELASETADLIREISESGALAELSAERVWGELTKALNGDAPVRFVTVLRSCSALSPWFPEFARTEPVAGDRFETNPQKFAAYVSGLSVSELDKLSTRLKAPRAQARMARWVVRHGKPIANWRKGDAESVYQALAGCQAFKPDSDLTMHLAVIEGLFEVDLAPLSEAVTAINEAVRSEVFVGQGLAGAALGSALQAARIRALDAAR